MISVTLLCRPEDEYVGRKEFELPLEKILFDSLFGWKIKTSIMEYFAYNPGYRGDIRYRLRNIEEGFEKKSVSPNETLGYLDKETLARYLGLFAYYLWTHETGDIIHVPINGTMYVCDISGSEKEKVARYLKEHALMIGYRILEKYGEILSPAETSSQKAIEIRVFDNQDVTLLPDFIRMIVELEKNLEEQVEEDPGPLEDKYVREIEKAYVDACLQGYKAKPSKDFIRVVERATGFKLREDYGSMEELLGDILGHLEKKHGVVIQRRIIHVNRRRQEYIARKRRALAQTA